MLAFNRVADLKYAFLESVIAATGVLTSNNTNVSDGDTVTIGGTTYRFKTVIAQIGDINIGASADASLTNLSNAINGGGTPGTDYFTGTPVDPNVSSSAVASHALTLTAKVTGQAGNNIATTKSAATLSWGDTTLDGGSGGLIKTYFFDTAETVNTDAIDVQAYAEAIAFIKMIAQSGTLPTLDCKIQYSYNYNPQTKVGDWVDSGDAFTQMTTSTGVFFKKLSANFGKYIRFVVTLGGTAPHYELDIALMGKL